MTQQHEVAICIRDYTFRVALYPLQRAGQHLWRAARMHRLSDGRLTIPRFPHFREGRTPGEALGRAAAQIIDQVLWEEHTPRPTVADGEPPWQALPPVRGSVSPAVFPPMAPEPVVVSALPPAADPEPAPSGRSRAERAGQLAGTIETAISRLAQQWAEGHTQEVLDRLAFYAKFHQYSINNCILIRQQCPDATQVAGLKRWNELGWRVRKGERAIWIVAPLLKREVNAVTDEETERLIGFRPATVFDASQLAEIDDKPLPTLFRPLPDDFEAQYQTVKARIERAGIGVEEGLLPVGVQGVSKGGQIVVRAGLDSGNRLAVLLHECAHELAHRGEDQRAKPRALRELEAESAAHVVGAVLGLEIPTSRDYLLSYGITAEVLAACFGTIQRLVRQMLTLVEGNAEVEAETRPEAA